MRSPAPSIVGRKRLLIVAPYKLSYKAAVELIAEKRSELKDRLVDPNTAPKFPSDIMSVDLDRVELVTGVKVNSYIPWKDTILETIDDLLKLEKEWIGKGFTIQIP